MAMTKARPDHLRLISGGSRPAAPPPVVNRVALAGREKGPELPLEFRLATAAALLTRKGVTASEDQLKLYVERTELVERVTALMDEIEQRLVLFRSASIAKSTREDEYLNLKRNCDELLDRNESLEKKILTGTSLNQLAITGCINLLKQVIPLLEQSLSILDETIAAHGLQP